MAVLLFVLAARAAAAAVETTQLLYPGLEPTIAQRLIEVSRIRDSTDYAAAEARARELLADCERAFDDESPEVTAAVIVLSTTIRFTKKPSDPERAALADRGLALSTKVFGPKSPARAVALSGLAQNHIDRGDFNGAKGPLTEAQAILESRAEPQDLLLSNVLVARGQLDQNLGEYPQARTVLERAVRIREGTLGPNDQRLGDVYNDLGNTLKMMGAYEESRRSFERAIQVRKAAFGESHAEVASAINNLGTLYRAIGDYVQARRCYEEAVAMKEKTLGPKSPSLARSYTNLANLLYLTGDYIEAASYYERALAIKEEELGPSHPSLIPALNGLVGVYEAIRDYDRANVLSKRLIDMCEATIGLSHPLGIQSLMNYGIQQTLLGHYATADSMLTLAKAYADTSLTGRHPLIPSIHDATGRLRFQQGRYADAIAEYETFLRLEPNLAETEAPRVADVLGRLALARALAGRTEDAFADALEAERLSREHFHLTAMTLAERQALRYSETRAHGLDLVLDLASRAPTGATRSKLVASAWDCLVRSRGLVLDEMAARGRALGLAIDPEARVLADSLVESKTRLANVLIRGPGGESIEQYRGLLEAARRRNESLEQRLAARHVSFRRQEEEAGAGLAEIQAALSPGEALVGFVRHKSVDLTRGGGALLPAPVEQAVRTAYAAFVLTHDRAPEVVPIGDGAAVDAAVAAWRANAVGAGERGFEKRPKAPSHAGDAEATGIALRRLVWDPLLPAIGDAERVFVVPDGALNLVNLYALPTSDGRFLVDEGRTLHLLSVERELVGSRSDEAGHGLLVVGGAAFDDAPSEPRPAAGSPLGAGVLVRSGVPERGKLPTCADFDALRFRELPGTAEEADQVRDDVLRAKLGPVTKLVGSQASEAEVKRAIPGRRLVHFATHGFFLGGDCVAASAKNDRGARRDDVAGLRIEGVQNPLAEMQSAEAAAGRTTEENPLLLSGLAFSGANRRGDARDAEEDGILTAEEIASLDLSGVEWAVLSACDTGVGEIRAGEGVFGLRRAFEVAGVRTTVMSLWPVDDASTRDWMSRLYAGRLFEGLDTADAVKWATRAALESRRSQGLDTSPFYWAGFVATGDWR